MPRLRLIGALALMLMTYNAHSTSLVMTTNGITGALKGTSNVTSKLSSSLSDSKIVLAARDDATSFVATAGAHRGAMLESALEYIRHEAPEFASRSDMQLALAIMMI